MPGVSVRREMIQRRAVRCGTPAAGRRAVTRTSTEASGLIQYSKVYPGADAAGTGVDCRRSHPLGRDTPPTQRPANAKARMMNAFMPPSPHMRAPP